MLPGAVRSSSCLASPCCTCTVGIVFLGGGAGIQGPNSTQTSSRHPPPAACLPLLCAIQQRRQAAQPAGPVATKPKFPVVGARLSRRGSPLPIAACRRIARAPTSDRFARDSSRRGGHDGAGRWPQRCVRRASRASPRDPCSHPLHVIVRRCYASTAALLVSDPGPALTRAFPPAPTSRACSRAGGRPDRGRDAAGGG
jgi:hypothetical protein